MTAQDIISALNLEPLVPEGGFFRQTFKDAHGLLVDGKTRAASTCIYYLLTELSFSAFHRVRGTEIFHFLRGEAAEMVTIVNGKARTFVLGSAFERGEIPQLVVPPLAWQALRTRGAWSLFGTTVSPGFEYEDFELGARASLMKEFPRHGELIRSLTR